MDEESADTHQVLQSYCPGIYIDLLRLYDRKAEAEEFMNKCKECENGENYSLYIHGYLTPWLQ